MLGKTPKFVLFCIVSLLAGCGGGSETGGGGGTEKLPTATVASVEVEAGTFGIMGGDHFTVKVTLSETVTSDASVSLTLTDLSASKDIDKETVRVQNGQRSATIRWLAPQPIKDTYAVSSMANVTASFNNSAATSNNFNIYKSPPADVLANTRGKLWQTDTQVELLVEQGLFQAVTTAFEPWTLPEQPTWYENPYESLAWQRDYHGLGWLYAFDAAYQQSGDAALLDKIKFYLFDYLQKVPVGANEEAAWDNLAVAWRLEALAYFYHKYFRSELNAADNATYVDAMKAHADVLLGYSTNYVYSGEHNGLYHAVSLMNLGVILPGTNNAEKYTAHASENILYIYNVLVDKASGATREQSTQRLVEALELFSYANGLNLVAHDRNIIDFYPLLSAMNDFASHLVFGHGEAPAMGNTHYGQADLRERVNTAAESGGIDSSFVRYLTSGGTEGEPLMASYLAKEQGYVIQRPGYSIDKPETYTFTDYGKRQEGKGHHDAGNVVAAYDGQAILVDSGGAENAGDYFSSAFAHNVLTVQNNAELIAGGEVRAAGCEHGLCYSIGKVSGPDHQYFRMVFSQTTGQGPRWTIVDIAASVYADLALDYQMMFHFAPDATVITQSDASACQQITLANGTSYCLQTQADLPQSVHYFKGLESETYTQGWVQLNESEKVAAPVIEMRSHGMELMAVTELRSATQSAAPLATVTRMTADTWDHTIDLGNYLVDVLYLTRSNPEVQITPTE
ncbi:heparinase II/III domain-containing protein [Pseudidiomarina insulisalsae]|uniref:Heparinase II/III-like C-terminal domain-containing protein n=1 Tax=Pseudidiomarina insulisalsae TaxID=575789 RepID=A0A432YNU7_9GAMM|nr:heparinase II/III family protein [Pseudidiomarina insulisalsae]RUO62578.1 hypothetical protein CWI71_03855 [Pseudidiomarina insulisalsae]